MTDRYVHQPGRTPSKLDQIVRVLYTRGKYAYVIDERGDKYTAPRSNLVLIAGHQPFPPLGEPEPAPISRETSLKKTSHLRTGGER